jgi:hypothetical protein
MRRMRCDAVYVIFYQRVASCAGAGEPVLEAGHTCVRKHDQD